LPLEESEATRAESMRKAFFNAHLQID
jgi:hypothetical protein